MEEAPARHFVRTLSALVVGAAVIVGGVTAPESAANAPAVPLSDCAETDNGNPVVTGISIEPKVVDARRSPVRLRIRITATDEGGPGPASGVAQVSLLLPRANIPLSLADDGSWQAQPLVTPGQWQPGVERPAISVRDTAGNVRYVPSEQLPDYGITVLTRRDRAAPVLRTLRISRLAVDTTKRAGTVPVTARVTDNRSGVLSVLVRAVGSGFALTKLRRVSGGRLDGLWRGDLRVSRWQRSGRLQLAAILKDRTRNRTLYGTRRLAAAGFPTHLAVTSKPDPTRAVVHSTSLTPTAVDVRAADATVTVDVHISDRQAPITGGNAWLLEPTSWRPVRADMTLRSGSRRDGVWRAVLRVSRCRAVSGTWRAEAQLFGEGGNGRLLQRIGSVDVTASDTLPPRPTAGISADGRALTVAFDEPVTGVSDASALVYTGTTEQPYLLNQRLDGRWTCQDIAAQPTDCAGTAVRWAEFAPAVPLRAGMGYEVRLNPEFTLDLRDLAGNPVDRQTRLSVALSR